MFRKKDDEAKSPDNGASEEHAYEDNWYRSLKALAEQRDDDPVEAEPQTEAEVATAPAEAGGEVAAAAVAEVAPPQDGEVSGTEDGEVHELLPPTELETRAGQLLERLRTLQHLGDPEG